MLVQSLKTSPALSTIIIKFSTCRSGFILSTKVAQLFFNYTRYPIT